MEAGRQGQIVMWIERELFSATEICIYVQPGSRFRTHPLVRHVTVPSPDTTKSSAVLPEPIFPNTKLICGGGAAGEGSVPTLKYPANIPKT